MNILLTHIPKGMGEEKRGQSGVRLLSSSTPEPRAAGFALVSGNMTSKDAF